MERNARRLFKYNTQMKYNKYLNTMAMVEMSTGKQSNLDKHGQNKLEKSVHRL